MSSLVKVGTGRTVAYRIVWAQSAWQRTRGLMFRPPLERGSALILDGAAQVHTFGVRVSIDVAFCSDAWVVLHVVARMKPLRVTRWVRGCRYAVELPAGAAGDLQPGDQLVLGSERVR